MLFARVGINDIWKDFTMSQIDKLKQLANAQKSGKSNMTVFSGLVCIHVGIPSKPYHKKIKGADGKDVKDENGKVMREKESSGTQITLVEFGTGKKVMAVFPKDYTLELLSAYRVGGTGYDIKSAGMYFLERDCTIANYG